MMSIGKSIKRKNKRFEKAVQNCSCVKKKKNKRFQKAVYNCCVCKNKPAAGEGLEVCLKLPLVKKARETTTKSGSEDEVMGPALSSHGEKNSLEQRQKSSLESEDFCRCSKLFFSP